MNVRNIISKHPVISFFTLTYLINWIGFSLHSAGLFPAIYELPLIYNENVVAVFRVRRTLLNWAPNFAAMIVIGTTHGWSGIYNLFKKFTIWRVGIKLWIRALLIPVLISIAAIFLHSSIGGKIDLSLISCLPMIFLLRFCFSLSTGGIGEEAGWRGFALPIMQKRFGAFGASLLIGFVWAFLHMPMWFLRQWDILTITYFVVAVICLSILLTWFYNKTNGSLLIVAVVHGMFNILDATLSNSYAAVISREDYMLMFMLIMCISSILILYVTKGRLGYKIKQ
ncbi:MAG: CPBP family intramembrane metalloprotease [Candidatus Omnitrophica bacterium]|nr:CPBP family intramembrane metalloprotease [Candidatus Omnitrophota bacterium]MBU1996000.1 CPBP family intramembrane metalloprotease [Candidatus Omnitrophota bacterium]MBU4334671.1 CPBP family intramembrane metalloprotease [Candidatus Omnitrophota bacterium]